MRFVGWGGGLSSCFFFFCAAAGPAAIRLSVNTPTTSKPCRPARTLSLLLFITQFTPADFCALIWSDTHTNHPYLIRHSRITQCNALWTRVCPVGLLVLCRGDHGCADQVYEQPVRARHTLRQLPEKCQSRVDIRSLAVMRVNQRALQILFSRIVHRQQGCVA